MAWSRCERLAILETNENGIRGCKKPNIVPKSLANR